MINKRRHRRKPLLVLVDYSDGKGFYQHPITDISHGGLYIKTRKMLPVGDELTLCFELRGRPMRIRARVVRHDAMGMGVSFLSGSDEDRQRVRELVGWL